MYDYVQGPLAYADMKYAVIDCGGVGYKCYITLNTYKKINGKPTVKLMTYLNVKEDALDLYGFADEGERTFFLLLLSVNGVGTKAALSILSDLTPEAFTMVLATNDARRLTKVSGIGVKTAQRICLELKDKISLFCNVPTQNVISNYDVENLYELPRMLLDQKMDDLVLQHLQINAPAAHMDEWDALVNRVKNLNQELNIALVGKYVQLPDAYLSVNEALRHAGYYVNSVVNIDFINSEELNKENVAERLKDADGIIVPGGFGDRGIAGMIDAIEYARTNNVPLLGICLGMQLITIEYARNVCGIKDANSLEFDELCKNPVINLMSDQSLEDMGGTQRLGDYECQLNPGTQAARLYGKELIKERHRHRYEFNNNYKDVLVENGLKVAGFNPERNLVEIVEIEDHPYYVGCQFHPEFTSRPNRAQPLFQGLISAAHDRKYNK